jgi:hypothetical protein
MKRWESWLQFVANGLVVGTGTVYGFMRYFMTPVDEWAVINHPWQPHVQHLHVLAAPLLVFACGLIWHRHVAGGIGAGEHRRGVSGPGLAVAFVPMIVSGYLLQTTSSVGWRQTWLALHLITSGFWALLVAAHFFRRRVARALDAPRPTLATRVTVSTSATSDRPRL